MTSRPAHPAPRRPANWRTRRLAGSIVTFLVFELATVGSLYAWPKVYEASASLKLEPARGAPKSLHHGTPEARVAALQQALFDWKGLTKFVAKWGYCHDPEESASSCLAANTSIEASGPSAYQVTVRDATSSGARATASALAEQLAALAPAAFEPAHGDSQALADAKANLRRAESDLATFEGEHPDLEESSPEGGQAGPDLAMLQAEQQELEQKVKKSRAATQGNPYAGAAETRRLEQRLKYVEQAIKVRKGSPKPKQKSITTENTALLEKLHALEEAKARAQRSVAKLTREAAPKPLVKARVIPAEEPQDSVEPNRPLIGFLGTWLALASVGVWWTTVTAAHRRRKVAARAAIVERAKQRLAAGAAHSERPKSRPTSDAPPSGSPESETIRSVPLRSAWRPETVASEPTDRLLSVAQELVALSRDKSQVVLIVAPSDSARLKSLSAARLGINIARKHQRSVLLVEAEFLKPQLQRILKLSMPFGSGFSQQLHTRIHSTEPRELTVVECTDHLHALVEGRLRCPGLVLSLEFANTINELRQRYPLILIDAPAEPSDVERRALEDVVDVVVVVVDEGRKRVGHPAETGPLASKVLRTLAVAN